MTDNKDNTVTLSIDDVEVTVPKGSNLIQAAKAAGKMIPHFCYHDGLSVAGQCRMCFVEIEGMPKLATACSMPAGDGMKVLTDKKSEQVKAAQNNTLEFTLLNHPLDCPICDRGGECKLQDFTYEFGPPKSRMDDERRALDKHRAVSEEIFLDQERCILCTRCVRFCEEVDGQADLVVVGRGSTNKIDVFGDEPMQSKFSGNVVDLCPVGALTAKDFRFQARPWELKTHDAICSGCAGGCNIEIHTKHRHSGIPRPNGMPPIPEIKRLVPRTNTDVNDWWLCDKGRWGYHFHNDLDKRLYNPQTRKNKKALWKESSLTEVQAELDQHKEWQFLIEDNVSHEGISWARELQKSWSARGRNVTSINAGSALAQSFMTFWNSRKTKAWNNVQPYWDEITTVVSTHSYRDLEDRAPMLALRLGQKVRQGKLKWVVRSSSKAVNTSDDLNSTAYLLLPPKTTSDMNDISNLDVNAKLLLLWKHCNARGLLNEGITPMEIAKRDFATDKNSGACMLFKQSSEERSCSKVTEYLAKQGFVVVSNSHRCDHCDEGNILLPVQPLWETKASLTNVENYRQNSAGIDIHHPNYPAISRGGELVSPALKLL